MVANPRVRMTPPVTPPLLSLSEAALQIGVRDVRTVRRLLATTGTPVLRVGRVVRVRQQDLEAALRRTSHVEARRVSTPARTAAVPTPTSVTVSNTRPRIRRRYKERLEPNFYRDHRASCPASATREPGYQCQCPTQWREKVAAGLYRQHTVDCESSGTRRPSRRCQCPFSCDLSAVGGSSQTKLDATTKSAAIREKGRRQEAALKAKVEQVVAPWRSGTAGEGERSEPVTVAQFFDDRVKAVVNGRTPKEYERIFDQYWRPRVGALDLASLDPRVVQSAANELLVVSNAKRAATGLHNPNAHRTLWSPMASVLKWARKDNILDGRFPRIVVPQVPARRPGERSGRTPGNNVVDEAKMLEIIRRVGAAGDFRAQRDELMVRLAFEVQLRKGEVRGIRIGDLDLDSGVLMLRWQIGDDGVEKRPKYATEESALPLSYELSAGLRTYLRRHPRHDDEGAFLFFGRDPTRPVCKDNMNKALIRAQRTLGYVNQDGRPLISVHGLRHSGASYLAKAGVPLWTVSRVLRHKDIRTTDRTYTHVTSVEVLRPVSDAFDHLQSGSASQCCEVRVCSDDSGWLVLVRGGLGASWTPMRRGEDLADALCHVPGLVLAHLQSRDAQSDTSVAA